jgi:iron complex transport system ATP-binding protein
MTMSPLIEVERVSVRRGLREVLCDLSFAVQAGDFLAIVGPNGAGKTTLLLTVLGLLRPGRGVVRVGDCAVHRLSRRDLARLISYVPQADSRAVSFSVEEFVLLGRYAHRERFAPPDREDRRVIRQAMEVTGTWEFRERPVGSLSGGERQKVFIAGALAQQARALLLDEPTVFLDPRHQVDTSELLRVLNREQGLTVVMVTHDINLAARCGRQVLALRDGSAAYLGPADGFLTSEVLEGVYGVAFEIVRSAAGRVWAVAGRPG